MKLEIKVSFLWLSLSVHSGSLKRIEYLKLYSLAHTLPLNVFSALKGTHFYILFVVTAAGVLLCGSPKKQPRTSSIVQFILFFWSFEISGNILRNQNFYMFRPMYSKQVFIILTPFGLISVFLLAALLKLEITVSFLWLSLPVHSGSLKRIYYSKLYCLAHTLLLNVFSALKGTHFYILFRFLIGRCWQGEYTI